MGSEANALKSTAHEVSQVKIKVLKHAQQEEMMISPQNNTMTDSKCVNMVSGSVTRFSQRKLANEAAEEEKALLG